MVVIAGFVGWLIVSFFALCALWLIISIIRGFTNKTIRDLFGDK